MDIRHEIVETKNPPPMRETERFYKVLLSIWTHEGFLTLDQIHRLAFPNASHHEARKYMAKMFQNGYVNRPDRQSRAAIGEQIYWLTEKGAEKIADQLKIPLSEVKYRRKLRRSLIAHDAQLNDIRLAIEGACELLDIEIARWQSSEEFWRKPVEILMDNKKKPTRRRVMPDGFFILRFPQQINKKTGEPEVRRFLLESDMSTESHSTFTFERLHVARKFFHSPQYKQMAGGKSSGRWVIVTRSVKRLRTMKEHVEQDFGEDAQLFWFTVIDRLTPQTVLTEHIWYRGGWPEPATLLNPDE